MNWDNYGKYNKDKMTWQIDHKIPQSKLPFKSFDDDNFRKLWALDNLQPLETVANIKKGNRAA
jgi:5-methylcytosine-specific restriction endonuclease McrA